MVSGQLEDSLRQEIESYIEGRLSGVKQEIAALQSQLNESLTRLMDRQSEVQIDGSLAASILEHLRAAHEEGINLAAAESSRARASSEMAIIKAAISEIHEQNSQAEILRVLVNRAASFAPRVAFFAIKGEHANGWRARGFQGTVGDDAIQQINIPVSANSIIGEAVRSHETWSGGPHAHAEDHLLLNRLGEETPQRVVSIPLTVRNRTVAVLYADSAGLDSEAINLEALETLVRVAGMAVELLSAARIPAKPAPETVAPATTEPEPSASYRPTVEYAEAPTYEEPVAAPEAEVEPVSAMQAETVSIEPPVETGLELRDSSLPEPEPQVGRRRFGADADLPVDVSSEEERRLHNDARRFARLLVSEIKLYNEQKVDEGRMQHDLYDRLREYIDRSREMYDKRVKPEVATKYDYFHHELVNTLAGGDEAKLGETYPGATVSA